MVGVTAHPPETVEVDHGPAVLTGRVAAVVALASAVVAGLYAWSALAFGTVGLLALVVGLVRGGRRTVSAGGVGVVAGGLAAGLAGAPVAVTLASVAGGVVAWDLGHRAVDLGEQLGRTAGTRRLEAVHVGASLLVGVLVVGLGYGVYLTGTGGQPVAMLAFLVVAAALAAAALS